MNYTQEQIDRANRVDSGTVFTFTGGDGNKKRK